MKHFAAFDANPEDRTCFDLLEWAAYDDDKLSIYRQVMRAERPCPLVDQCEKGQQGQNSDRPFQWERHQRTLF